MGAKKRLVGELYLEDGKLVLVSRDKGGVEATMAVVPERVSVALPDTGQRVEIRKTANYIVDGQAGRYSLSKLADMTRSDLYSQVSTKLARRSGQSKSKVRNVATRATDRIVKFAAKHGIAIQ